MRRVSVVIAVCFILALALTVTGQQQGRDLDTLMKEIGPLWSTPGQGIQAKVAANDLPGYAADAARLEGLFNEVRAAFEREQLTQGAEWSKVAAEAAGAVAKQAKAGTFTINQAQKQGGLVINCGECHGVYREKNPTTGQFQLKRP